MMLRKRQGSLAGPVMGPAGLKRTMSVTISADLVLIDAELGHDELANLERYSMTL